MSRWDRVMSMHSMRTIGKGHIVATTCYSTKPALFETTVFSEKSGRAIESMAAVNRTGADANHARMVAKYIRNERASRLFTAFIALLWIFAIAWVLMGCGSDAVECKYSFATSGVYVCSDVEVETEFIDAVVAATDEALAKHYPEIGSLETLLDDAGFTLLATDRHLVEECADGPQGLQLCESSPSGSTNNSGSESIVQLRWRDPCGNAITVVHELLHVVEAQALDGVTEDHDTPNLFKGGSNAWGDAAAIFAAGVDCNG